MGQCLKVGDMIIFGKNALLLCEGKIGLAADGNKIKIVHVN